MNSDIAERFENNVDFIPDEVTGIYDIPVIKPEEFVPVPFIPFHEAARCTREPEVGVHFFIYDFFFQRIWMMRNKYGKLLQRFNSVMTPDFSTYTDWPFMVQLFNHYRKHLLGAWMQSLGIRVYPTISWSDESSYSWCFDGEPHGATVCVSSVGTQKNAESKRLFQSGYDRMLEVLEPKTIVFYGKVPDGCRGNIVPVEPYYKKIEERSDKNVKT